MFMSKQDGSSQHVVHDRERGFTEHAPFTLKMKKMRYLSRPLYKVEESLAARPPHSDFVKSNVQHFG